MKHTVPVHQNTAFKQMHKNLEKCAHDTNGAQLSLGILHFCKEVIENNSMPCVSYIHCMFLICFQYQTNEMYKEVHTKERLEEELKEMSTNLERKESEVTNLKLQLGQAQLNIGKLETSTKDLKVFKGRKQ
jgi:hypothetical protein